MRRENDAGNPNDFFARKTGRGESLFNVESVMKTVAMKARDILLISSFRTCSMVEEEQ